MNKICQKQYSYGILNETFLSIFETSILFYIMCIDRLIYIIYTLIKWT